MTGITFGLKEFEAESLIILSQPWAFSKVGSYEQTRWRTLVYLDPTALAAPLADYEASAVVGGSAPDDKADASQVVTRLAAPCELQIELQQTDSNLTPSTITRSSQIFSMILERELVN